MNNDLFKNQYRIPSTRLPGWDYSWPGAYFITICTADRQIFFGNVVNNQMVLNNIDQVVNYYWSQIPEYFENVILDEHIIMPNHIHGAIIINDKNSNNLFDGINYFLEYGFNPCVLSVTPPVETPHQDITTIHENSFNDNNPNTQESSAWGVSIVPSTTKTPHQQKTQMNNFSNNQDLI